jgi:hypothetical protein
MTTNDNRHAPALSAAVADGAIGGTTDGDRPRWHDSTAPGGAQGTTAGYGGRTGAAVPAGQGSAVPAGLSASSPAAGGCADPWPSWARADLLRAVGIAESFGTGAGLAAELHRSWFTPVIDDAVRIHRGWAPLGGTYRHAHAGGGSPISVDGVCIVDRHDVIGRDGWWRTWGEAWQPTRSRAGSVRLMLTPRIELVAEFVTAVTAAMLDTDLPWLLACSTDPRRLRRAGAAVLHLPAAENITFDLVARLLPTLRPGSPALCEPIAPGMAVSEDPGFGLSFGRHRCAIVADALADRDGGPLAAVAAAFVANGLDPRAPHRSPRS